MGTLRGRTRRRRLSATCCADLPLTLPAGPAGGHEVPLGQEAPAEGCLSDCLQTAPNLPGCGNTPTLCLRRRSSGAICMQRGRPCTPPVQGGLMDREAGFRLVESARKRLFFYFFVVQRGMNGDLPGKRRRDPRAQQMRPFFFYVFMFFFCPGSPPPHPTSRPRSQKPRKKWY